MIEAISGTVDITPRNPLATACHGPRDVPARGVGYALEANALALREENALVVLVTVDWFYCSPTLRSAILARCAGMLEEHQLMVAASHAHTAPNTDRTKTAFSHVDAAYLEWAEDRIAGLVFELLQSSLWRRARLRFATEPWKGSIHRRRVIRMLNRRSMGREVAIYPNAAGPRDQELRLLRIEDAEGGLLAIVWGVSCHLTDWPRLDEISSDFAGGVRNALRAIAGADTPVLFLQGFAGTLRPRSIGFWPRTGTWRSRLLKIIHIVLNGPGFVGFTPRLYGKWLGTMAESANSAFRSALTAPACMSGLRSRRASVPLSALGIQGATEQLTCQVVELGSELVLVGISAEVAWEYAPLVARQFAGKRWWPVGYIDTTFGYLPSASMLREGGYEVDGFMPLFGISGKWVENIEDLVLNGLPHDQP